MAAERPRSNCRILVADDNPAMVQHALGRSRRARLRRHDRDVGAGRDPTGTRQHDRRARDRPPDARDVDGLELLALSKRVAPERPVLVMTAFGADRHRDRVAAQGRASLPPQALQSRRARSLHPARARDSARSGRRRARSSARSSERYGMDSLVAESGAMQEVRDLVERMARCGRPRAPPRRDRDRQGALRPLPPCPEQSGRRTVRHGQLRRACPEPLLESELFGHVKGAFTGAGGRDAKGLLVGVERWHALPRRNRGDVPVRSRPSSSTSWSGGWSGPWGPRRSAPSTCAVLACHAPRPATERVASGAFREDLRYRLDVCVRRSSHRSATGARTSPSCSSTTWTRRGGPSTTGSPPSDSPLRRLARLVDYRWPGNVRELSHAVARAVVLGRSAEAALTDLPSGDRRSERSRRPSVDFGDAIMPAARAPAPVRRLGPRSRAVGARQGRARSSGSTARRSTSGSRTVTTDATRETETRTATPTDASSQLHPTPRGWRSQVAMLLSIAAIIAAAVWSAASEQGHAGQSLPRAGAARNRGRNRLRGPTRGATTARRPGDESTDPRRGAARGSSQAPAGSRRRASSS